MKSLKKPLYRYRANDPFPWCSVWRWWNAHMKFANNASWGDLWRRKLIEHTSETGTPFLGVDGLVDYDLESFP